MKRIAIYAVIAVTIAVMVPLCLAQDKSKGEDGSKADAATTPIKYKSPLREMTDTTPTCLWNDSASIPELTYALDHGAVGGTCTALTLLTR